MCALLSAIKAERIFQIKLLFADASVYGLVDHVDENGHTCLIKACLMKSKWKGLVVTKLLIEHDADLSVIDNAGRTCLTYACITRKESLVKVLIGTGDIAPNTRDIYSYTNLMHSVLSGSQPVVTTILVFLNRYRLSLDDRTKSGFTAYMLALKFGYFAIARILQENGASTETFDFVKFKNSEHWGRLSCKKNNSDFQELLHNRSKTAPQGLRPPQQQRQQKQRKDSMTVHEKSQTAKGSLLSSIVEKIMPVEIYHDPYVRSTSVFEASTIFKQGMFTSSKHDDSNSTHMNTVSEDDFLSNGTNNENLRSTEVSKHDQRSTLSPRTTFSTKTILGVLLNESMLTRAQIEQDEKRLVKIIEYKRKMVNADLPLISLPVLFDEKAVPSRCHSSIPSRGGRGQSKYSGTRRMTTFC